MMTEYVRQKHNVAIAEKRVGTASSMLSQQYRQQRRTSRTRVVNLIPCRAAYFGHKLHINQNKKLVAHLLTACFVKLVNL